MSNDPAIKTKHAAVKRAAEELAAEFSEYLVIGVCRVPDHDGLCVGHATTADTKAFPAFLTDVADVLRRSLECDKQ